MAFRDTSYGMAFERHMPRQSNVIGPFEPRGTQWHFRTAFNWQFRGVQMAVEFMAFERMAFECGTCDVMPPARTCAHVCALMCRLCSRVEAMARSCRHAVLRAHSTVTAEW